MTTSITTQPASAATMTAARMPQNVISPSMTATAAAPAERPAPRNALDIERLFGRETLEDLLQLRSVFRRRFHDEGFDAALPVQLLDLGHIGVAHGDVL